MPQHVDWYDDTHTVAIMTFEGRWTWEDFFNARTTVHELMNTVDHQVDVVADFTPANGMPIGGSAFSLARNSLENSRPNLRLLVICGANRLIDAMVKMFTKVFSSTVGKRIRTAPNLEDAVALCIAERDAASTGER